MRHQQGRASQNTCNTCFVKGNVTIDHFEDIRNTLVKALLSSDLLVIDLEEVENIDIEGIMLLCAINRSAELRGKRVELTGVDGELASLIVSAGFPRMECSYRMSHSCLWNVVAPYSATSTTTLSCTVRRGFE